MKRAIEPEHSKLTAHIASGELVIDIRAAGPARAFEGLAVGSCDLGMASRAINSKEVAALAAKGHGDLSSPATEHEIGLHGIAVIVHLNNPLAMLDRGQLHDLFTGKITDWGELGGTPGPFVLGARDAKSGTFDTFKNLVLGADVLANNAQRLAESDMLADRVASSLGDRLHRPGLSPVGQGARHRRSRGPSCRHRSRSRPSSTRCRAGSTCTRRCARAARWSASRCRHLGRLSCATPTSSI